MGKNGFHFLEDHSLKFLEMAYSYVWRGVLDNADGYGKNTGDCGDTVEFFIKVDNGSIATILFDAEGCLNTKACASAVASFAEKQPLEDLWKITPEKVIDYLETLPAESEHCAELAVGAFYLALNNYKETEQKVNS